MCRNLKLWAMSSKNKRIGIEEARGQLGELVTQAQQGTDIILTRNGRPAARLTRYQEESMWEIDFAANTPYQANRIIAEALHDERHGAWEGGLHGYVFTGGYDAVEAVRVEVAGRNLAHTVTKRA